MVIRLKEPLARWARLSPLLEPGMQFSVSQISRLGLMKTERRTAGKLGVQLGAKAQIVR
jgi:hypothetical protein